MEVESGEGLVKRGDNFGGSDEREEELKVGEEGGIVEGPRAKVLSGRESTSWYQRERGRL